MTPVALVTCTEMPEADVDEPLYAQALAAHGLRCSVVPWDDPGVRWSDFALVVLRSTWNYHRRLPAFMAWLDALEPQVKVLNPPALVRWNVHKGYLLQLERAGIDIVPTRLVPRGATTSLDALQSSLRATDLVIKPAVSAGSHRTLRATAANTTLAETHLRELVRDADVLAQPYLRAVEGSGERAIVCFDGAVSHAVRKSPRFGGDDESVSPALPVSAAERDFAIRVLAAVGTLLPHSAPPAYARVDVLTDDDGTLRLMELELIEPSLFLLQAPAALDAFARALAARV